jgi:hypothetical protein
MSRDFNSRLPNICWNIISNWDDYSTVSGIQPGAHGFRVSSREIDMALQVINSDLVGTGDQVTLGTDDDVYVAAGVVVASTDGNLCIAANGADHIVHVEGQLATDSYAIQLGLGNATVDCQTYLGTDSIVRSFGTVALALYGGGHTVEMRGKVFAEAYGVQLVEGTGVDSFVTNSGTISANDTGCYFETDDYVYLDNSGVIKGVDGIYVSGGGGMSIDNSGTIKGSLHGIETFGDAGAFNIANSGTIRLGAILSGVADIYRGQEGRITGDLVAGAGDDTIMGGAYGERFEGDAGRDIMTGGAGADFFIYVDDGDSTLHADGRDIIGDFSHRQRDIVDFSTLITGELDFVGKAQFSGDNEIRYKIIGQTTYVYVNLDNDSTAEMAIQFGGKIKFGETDFAL